MPNKLVVFVEGPDDEKFFEEVLKPFFKGRHKTISHVKYARANDETVNKIIGRLADRKDSVYIFTADLDEPPRLLYKSTYSTKHAKLLREHTEKRTSELKEKYPNVDEDRIDYVITEIEGWYLAGLDDSYCRRCGISLPSSTDDITKQKFEQIRERSKRKRIDRSLFLAEILLPPNFSPETAKKKNKSFRNFLSKYNCHL